MLKILKKNYKKYINMVSEKQNLKKSFCCRFTRVIKESTHTYTHKMKEIQTCTPYNTVKHI